MWTRPKPLIPDLGAHQVGLAQAFGTSKPLKTLGDLFQIGNFQMTRNKLKTQGIPNKIEVFRNLYLRKQNRKWTGLVMKSWP